jgi:Flp pilus assembly protein TadD
MAYVYLFADWNFAAAEAELAAVRQKDGSALNNLASVRAMQGRTDETIALRKEAVRLEPLHAEFRRILGNALQRIGRLDEAEAEFRRAIELQPEARAHYSLTLLAIQRGDLDTALREALLEREWGGTSLAVVRFARGERDEAEAALQAHIQADGERRPATVASVYAFRGETDQMFEWLNRSYAQREPTLVAALGWHPFFVRYYSDPRFVELCRKTGVTLPK